MAHPRSVDVGGWRSGGGALCESFEDSLHRGSIIGGSSVYDDLQEQRSARALRSVGEQPPAHLVL